MSKLSKNALAIAFFLAIVCSSAWAEVYNYKGHLDYNAGDKNEVYDKFTEAQINQSNTLSNCNCRLPYLPPGENPCCAQSYNDFYAPTLDRRTGELNVSPKTGIPIVNMKIIFGYADATPLPYSLDPIYAGQLKRKLLEPCAQNNFACGFRLDPIDDERLTKTIKGPDGRPREIDMRIMFSSYTTSRATNEANPEIQKFYSEHAEQELLDFSKPSALTLYAGHARTKCGLGTFMPPLTKIERRQPDGSIKLEDTVDYAMECKRGVMKRLASALDNAIYRPKIFSQFACGSNPNMPGLLAKYPDMASQTISGFGFAPDWPYEIYGTLNGLLGQVCEPTLSQMINPPVIDPRTHISFSKFQCQ